MISTLEKYKTDQAFLACRISDDAKCLRMVSAGFVYEDIKFTAVDSKGNLFVSTASRKSNELPLALCK